MAALTPEQARDLVSWAGGQRAAGRAVGVTHATVQGWLNPERKREAQRKSRRKAWAEGRTWNQRSENRTRVQEIDREHVRRKRGWYDSGGMASDDEIRRLSEFEL